MFSKFATAVSAAAFAVASLLGASPASAHPVPHPTPSVTHTAPYEFEWGYKATPPVQLPELHKGSLGPFVVMLQSLLNEEKMYTNHTPLKQDGVFGKATKQAVIKYQKSESDEGLRTDGYVDNETWKSITTLD